MSIQHLGDQIPFRCDIKLYNIIVSRMLERHLNLLVPVSWNVERFSAEGSSYEGNLKRLCNIYLEINIDMWCVARFGSICTI